ncbi:MAG: uracil-DNA glycosylase family protein [Eubacteriales bacterium]
MEWSELETACAECRGCGLWQTRTHTVFGCGNRNADLMFVGEGPGEREDATGIPFVGAAGMLLDKYFAAVGIEREEVYIANILKCRPPNNRDPLPEEGDACIGFLRGQVRLVRPRMIVCLGRIAAARLIHTDFKITREHGQIVTRGGFAMTAVYHPAALLRDASKKEDMLWDMKKIKAYLDAMPPRK